MVLKSLDDTGPETQIHGMTYSSDACTFQFWCHSLWEVPTCEVYCGHCVKALQYSWLVIWHNIQCFLIKEGIHS